jgi:hypothetical protein
MHQWNWNETSMSVTLKKINLEFLVKQVLNLNLPGSSKSTVLSVEYMSPSAFIEDCSIEFQVLPRNYILNHNHFNHLAHSKLGSVNLYVLLMRASV